ncbi:hypothetical protein N7466_002605 [Penicillium verhagenii]|uniref:uncharacterized protein n=1 Tax=Penicillium verhagenii TaxID=1562060 RepID=UPI00254532D5|nr:uncharacterized protein N7466_002605 [Penicillium verhagenii]KAJ5939471.1 hypothetical protein N7466_002605 [Penicillium verhagenii]
MNSSGSLSFHPPPGDSEGERIAELSRYYCTVDRPVANATFEDEAPTGDEQPSAASLSSDITLNALAQLGVFRLGCNRSFVSIIDRDSQYIIAEATKSVSLRITDQHLPDDGIYLGARRLDLEWGVCPHTISLFTGRGASVIDTPNVTANRSRYIIRDFTKEDCFRDRPYVREWPHMRFYAEVPLFSPSGYVLGSYCVVDDSPREEFGDAEIALLQEVSDAIAIHLENTRSVHYHRRAEQLVKGLTSFVKDYSDFDPREVSSDHRLQSMDQNFIPDLVDGPGSQRPMTISLPDRTKDGERPSIQSALTTPSEEPSSLFFQGSTSGTTELTSLMSNTSDRPFPSPSEEKSLIESFNPSPSLRLGSNASPVVSISEQISTIFARASVILKESISLDGVAFLDAAHCNPSFHPTEDQGNWEPLPKRAASYSTTMPGSLDPLNAPTVEVDAMCEILGSSLKTQPQGLSLGSTISVPEKLLNVLVTHFPQGQIFDIPCLEDSADGQSQCHFDASLPPQNFEMITRHLAHILPGATSVLFCPLWDYHKSRWMAGTLVWTRNSRQPLETDELHYFKVFSDAIVSEIARIHWSTTEKSKFDFISSVSHELRSPLHGILASAELLHTTSLEPVQGEMIRMIESSGNTLLDTTDQLLAFCKINNSSKIKQRRKEQEIPSEISKLVSDFDLGDLVEEVTNILYNGQRASASSSTSTAKTPIPMDTISGNDSNEMSVIVRIEQSLPWQVRSQAGAWRRIIMNLLGNSMKWTKKGFVEVSLSQSRTKPDSQSALAHLSVIDTGSGIAPEFLRHKLFSTFTQEDPLTDGVGLGLSIVRLLVTSLGGKITVKSELGIGTQVDVFIPVQSVIQGTSSTLDSFSSIAALQSSIPHLHPCLVAFNGYPDLTEAPTGLLTAEAKRKLSIQSNLADVFLSRFGWGVSLAESLDKVHGDIAVIEEATLQAETTDRAQSLEKVASAYGIKFFIILGKRDSALHNTAGTNFVRVSQPFGPRKIFDAVQTMLEAQKAQLQQPDELLLSTVNPDLEQTPTSVIASDGDEGETTPKATTEAVVAPFPQVDPNPPSTGPKVVHVLVVDDNDINVKIMATFLHKIGCTYETASNGLIALEKYMASTKPYDFVLMDISMPVMDGILSTKKIRQFEKETGLIPSCIMAVTGVASDAMHQQALAAGINDYLIKPLSLQNLKSIMGIA